MLISTEATGKQWTREEEFLISLLALQVEDYAKAVDAINGINFKERFLDIVKKSRGRRRTRKELRVLNLLMYGLDAKDFIFIESNNFFSFNHVCSLIELDPEKFRKKIRKLKAKKDVSHFIYGNKGEL